MVTVLTDAYEIESSLFQLGMTFNFDNFRGLKSTEIILSANGTWSLRVKAMNREDEPEEITAIYVPSHENGKYIMKLLFISGAEG